MDFGLTPSNVVAGVIPAAVAAAACSPEEVRTQACILLDFPFSLQVGALWHCSLSRDPKAHCTGNVCCGAVAGWSAGFLFYLCSVNISNHKGLQWLGFESQRIARAWYWATKDCKGLAMNHKGWQGLGFGSQRIARAWFWITKDYSDYIG